MCDDTAFRSDQSIDGFLDFRRDRVCLLDAHFVWKYQMELDPVRVARVSVPEVMVGEILLCHFQVEKFTCSFFDIRVGFVEQAA